MIDHFDDRTLRWECDCVDCAEDFVVWTRDDEDPDSVDAKCPACGSDLIDVVLR